ncbi:DMT family transporter [Alicyclobacillus dauci]|uniref:DMT family transporter n=1 Tax=Alicyclobacillus dauci TaxID=1475485 RepID=A0ABY6Z519_9BACL|nr:DMT family transporter [Alicyclobacillus dauci]WAH37115.1 DMT family transporter [Alicyclobacillus dauci]
MEGISRTRAALLITFLVIMWGVNWPLTKIALQYTPPILFAGIRTVLGGLLLLIVAIPRRHLLRFKQTWHIYVISSLLNIVLYYGLQTVGLKYLPAGLFSVIVFLQPVLLGILSWAWLGESMYGLKVAGLVLGFAGVAVISGGSLSGHLSVVGVLLALGSAVAWALGTAYVKKTSETVDSIWLVTVQLIIGGLAMTALGSGVESWSSIVWNVPFISILAFIAVFVIAAGWLVFFILIGSGEASKVASYTFLIPLISILIGTIFLHEPFTMYLLAGLVLIVVSIYFVNRPRKMSSLYDPQVESSL